MAFLSARRVGLLLALFLVLGLAIAPASAQCAESVPGVYDCTGVQNGSVNVGSGTVTVNVGVDDANDDTVEFITTDGAIVAEDGSTLTLIVFAGDTLDSNDYAVLVDGSGTVVATGYIEADSHGIWVKGGSITFGAQGEDYGASTIDTDDIALWVDGNGNIVNYGIVDGEVAGAVVGHFDSVEDLLSPSVNTGSITNYGEVTGGLAALGMYGSGTINNYGAAVGGTGMLAIGDGWTVNNGDSTDYKATAEGLVGVAGYGSGTVNNSGFVGGDFAGMVLVSRISIGGYGLDELLSGDVMPDILLPNIADLINSMEFEGEMTVNNDGLIQAPVGVLLLGNGTINNSEEGEIQSMFLGAGGYGNIDINNSGAIAGGFVGAAVIGQVQIDDFYLPTTLLSSMAPDTPSITAADDSCLCILETLFQLSAMLGSTGITFDGGGTITNSGTIGDYHSVVGGSDAPLAPSFGNTMLGALVLGNGAIDNSGMINGALAGAALVGNGDITNSGLVVSEGIGLLLVGTVTFDENWVTTLDAAPSPFVGMTFGGGTITNTGVVAGYELGIGAVGNVTVNNSGLVISEHVGIGALGDVTINVMDGGTVVSGGTAIVGGFGNQTVNVDGTVVGGEGSSAPAITDTLSVIPATVAIELNEGNDRVNLRSGANVTGDIDMGDDDDTVQISAGAQVDGLIDGGDHVNGDTLIVGNETICGEAQGAHQRFFGTRDLVESIDLSGDTFTFDGQQYSIEDFELGRSGVEQVRCFPFIEDGRINAYDHGASVAGYCNAHDGLNGWAIDGQGNGQADFSVSGEQMRTALQQAISSGQHVNVASGARGTSLWALSSNQYQMMGPDGYAYIFEPGRCGPGGVAQ